MQSLCVIPLESLVKVSRDWCAVVKDNVQVRLIISCQNNGEDSSNSAYPHASCSKGAYAPWQASPRIAQRPRQCEHEAHCSEPHAQGMQVMQ